LGRGPFLVGLSPGLVLYGLSQILSRRRLAGATKERSK
jgi:hypothetical protein